MQKGKLQFEIGFGPSGNNSERLGRGWAPAEANGHRWTIGKASEIWIPPLAASTPHALVLKLTPHISAGVLARRIWVWIGNTLLGTSEVRAPTYLAFRIPARAIEDQSDMKVVFESHDRTEPPDSAVPPTEEEVAFAVHSFAVMSLEDTTSASEPAVRLNESRALSRQWDLADIEAQLGISVRGLMLNFSSLGDSCEFGLVQRRAGAEPLGLLRFSSTFLCNLIEGLNARFDGLGTLDDIEVQVAPSDIHGRHEYMIQERQYNLLYHPFAYTDTIEQSKLLQRESRRLTFLREKFIDELESAEKIFVVKRDRATEAEILALVLALRNYGPVWVLWVVATTEQEKWGCVELLQDGLLRGYIDRFAPTENAYDLSFDQWSSICANSYRIQQACLTELEHR